MRMLRRVLVGLALTLTFARADSLILEAQKKLKRMGYYDGAMDGEIGSQTAAAIRRYQLAEKLKITGELNQQTLDDLQLSRPSTVSRSAQSLTLARIFQGGPLFSKGARQQLSALRRAQKRLMALDFYNGPISDTPSTALVAAIKAWQKTAGLPQTGRLDGRTLEGLDLI